MMKTMVLILPYDEIKLPIFTTQNVGRVSVFTSFKGSNRPKILSSVFSTLNLAQHLEVI